MRTVYICRDCGHVFCAPLELRTAPVFYEPVVSYLCPACGGAEFAGARECAKCGEWREADKLSHGLCPDCVGITIQGFQRALNFYSQAELDVLTDHWEGEAFTKDI